MTLYAIEATSNSVETYFTPFLVTSNWTTITKWNDQPSINYSVRGSSEPVKEPGIVFFDVTSIVKNWIDFGPNYGLLLKSTETIDYSTKTFISCYDSVNPDLKPFLTINYNINYPFPTPVPISVSNREFTNIESSSISTTTTFQESAAINLSNKYEYTVFIKNTGSNTIDLYLEVGPTDSDFLTDRNITIPPGDLSIIVPKYFTEFIRFKYASTIGNSSFQYWINQQC